MKLKTICLLILLFFSKSFSQDIKKLENNNGFRSIKLGSEIRNYPNFIKKSEQNSKYFSPWFEYDYILNLKKENDFKKIGDAEILQILAKVYNNKIYQIQIVTEKDNEVIEMLETAYGKPNFDDIKADILGWRTESGIQCEVMGRAGGYSQINIRYRDLNLESLAQKKDTEEKKKKAISEF